jgi:hypothetical protein
MIISGYDIQPLMIYLPDTELWRNRYEQGKKHFEEQGITDIKPIYGIYGHGFGIMGTHLYEYDNPGGKHQIGVANTSLCLSVYNVYNVANCLPNSHFLHLEDDSRFKEGWREIVEQALNEIPKDFDFLFIGSCCAEGKEMVKVGTNLYHFPNTRRKYAEYPLCGNAYIVAKKAIPLILDTQRDAYVNADINLAVNTFNYLKVYAILPRPVEQNNNEQLAP